MECGTELRKQIRFVNDGPLHLHLKKMHRGILTSDGFGMLTEKTLAHRCLGRSSEQFSELAQANDSTVGDEHMNRGVLLTQTQLAQFRSLIEQAKTNLDGIRGT